MHPKVLLIMTTPYSVSDSSRTLDAYFHYWEKDRLFQIFSRNWVPSKGQCGEMYQITDSSLLKKWMHKNIKIGKVYTYDDMGDTDGHNVIAEDAAVSFGYKLGTKHTPLIEILRGILWRRKYWLTPELIKWLDEFHPDCILYNFSNHLFTQQIALFAAHRYHIPIIAIIGDDYYFNDTSSLNPFYLYFRYKFKQLTEKILAKGHSSAVYCSDKIRDKYNPYFHIHGKTIYINSALKRKDFQKINSKNPKIVYFGSIRLGRNIALVDIANALGSINPNFRLEVYTSENDPSIYGVLKENPYVIYGGFIPYSQVQAKIRDSDIFVIAEGFRKQDINFTKYSLSTKASDGLASGVSIFSYGPAESGVIDYMKSTGASMVCTSKQDLKKDLESLISNPSLQEKMYHQAIVVTEKNHTLKSTTRIFESILEDAINQDKD